MTFPTTLLRHLLPKPIRDMVASRVLRPLFADEQSADRFWQVRYAQTGEPVTMRVAALGGATVTLRPGTEDAVVFIDTFYGRHHEVPHSAKPARRIVDLGANIGLTTAHLAYSNRSARVTAVEMDPDNAALCRMNIAPWRDRCDVREAAVWPHPGPVHYQREGRLTSRHNVASDGTRTTPAVSLNDLIGADEVVDYMKIDIEGSEAELLQVDTSWASRVKTMRIEVHGSYRVRECMSDLRVLGFDVERDRKTSNQVIAARAL